MRLLPGSFGGCPSRSARVRFGLCLVQSSARRANRSRGGARLRTESRQAAPDELWDHAVAASKVHVPTRIAEDRRGTAARSLDTEEEDRRRRRDRRAEPSALRASACLRTARGIRTTWSGRCLRTARGIRTTWSGSRLRAARRIRTTWSGSSLRRPTNPDHVVRISPPRRTKNPDHVVRISPPHPTKSGPRGPDCEPHPHGLALGALKLGQPPTVSVR